MKLGTNDIGSVYLGTNAVQKVYLGNNLVYSAVDADAQAFIDAAGITDGTQQEAINALVVDLKSYGLWTKMKAIYPFVGGTATTHKYNLKDPRDLDAAFRLSFSSGWTHNANGAETNGIGAYADTHLNPNSEFGSNYAHQSFYNKINNTSGTLIQGCSNSNNNRFDMGYDSGNSVPFVAIGNTGSTLGSDNSTLGFILSYRTGSNAGKMLRNNVLKVSINTTFTSYAAIPYYLGKRNSLNLQNPMLYAFASLGDTLTDSEASDFYDAVQAFQTTLGREE